MPHDGFGAHDEANEQAVPAMSGTEPGATPDSVPTSRPEPVVGFDKTPDPDPAPDSAPTSQLEPPLDLEPTPDPNPTPERSPVAPSRTDRLERHILPLLIPPVLLLVITAIVVTLGSALLLLSTSELTIGQIVVAWPVVAAALGVLVIGFGALWLASRETVSPGDH